MLLALTTRLSIPPKLYARGAGWKSLLLFSQPHTEQCHSTLQSMNYKATLLLLSHSCTSVLTVPSHRQSHTTEYEVLGQKAYLAHILQRLMLTVQMLPVGSG